MGYRFFSVVGAVSLVALVSCGDDPNDLGGGTASGSSGSSGAASSSGSSGDTSSSGGTTGDGTAADLCVETINKYRATNSLPPLTRWTDSESCSDGEAESDGSTKKPHGAAFKCGENAQNECPGWPGPPASMITDCLKAMWDQGPGEGHHDNMASKQWTKVGCGFSTLADGSVWAVQNFK